WSAALCPAPALKAPCSSSASAGLPVGAKLSSPQQGVPSCQDRRSSRSGLPLAFIAARAGLSKSAGAQRPCCTLRQGRDDSQWPRPPLLAQKHVGIHLPHARQRHDPPPQHALEIRDI